MNNMHRIVLVIAALALAACSSPGTINGSPQGEHWQLQGRIGLWLDDRQESGNIDWRQCGDNSAQLRISGPLGVGGFEIRSNKNGAELQQGDATFHAGSIEELAYQAGWPVPVQALQYWVRGKAAPGAPLRGELDQAGRLKALEQYGWQIRYLDYFNSAEKLPTKIEATKDQQRIKLIIRNWNEPDCP